MTLQLKCEDLLSYLSDYIDGNLNEELSAAAQAHLATCQNCRVVLDSTQKAILLYREYGQVQEIPAGRRDALYDRIAKAFSAKKAGGIE